jgi:hypothetical protein
MAGQRAHADCVAVPITWELKAAKAPKVPQAAKAPKAAGPSNLAVA